MTKSDGKIDWLPLTLAQLDFWEEFMLHPDLPVSTVAHCIELQGAIDEVALREAITQAVQEADVLSMRFQMLPDVENPLQLCTPVCTPQLRSLDMRGDVDAYSAARQLMAADISARLDLLTDPLSAQWLLRISDDRWLWYIRGHHIILDGFSMLLLEQRCARLYSHFLGNANRGEAFHRFSSYIAEEQAYRDSERFRRDGDFWQRYLDVPVELPVLRKGGEDYGGGGQYFECALPYQLGDRLQKMSTASDIGWTDLLVTLSAAYLFHHFPPSLIDGRRILPVWLPFMSRWGSVSAYMPALILNILPLLVTIDPQESLSQFLQRTAADLRRQRNHGRYRIEQIDADRGLPKGTRYFFSPLINVLPFDPPDFENCRTERHVLAAGPADGFNITYRSRSDGAGLVLSLEADALIGAHEFEAHTRALPDFLMYVLSGVAPVLRMKDLFEVMLKPEFSS